MGVRSAIEEGKNKGECGGGAGAFQPDIFAPDAPLAVPVPVAEARKVGRPKGAVGKKDREIIEFIQNTKGDPRLALANVMAMTPDQVKKYFGFTGKGAKERAAEFWKSAVLGLMPFMAGKPTVSVEVHRKETRLSVALGFTGQIGSKAAAHHGASIICALEEAAARERAAGFGAGAEDPENAAIVDAVATAMKSEA